MQTYTITTEQEVVVSLGKAGTVTVGLNRISSDVAKFIFDYGLRQILNDAHASEKEPEAKMGLTLKRLENLYDGKTGRAGPRAARDPETAEATRLAKAKWKSLSETDQTKYLHKQDAPNDEAALAAVMAKLIEAYRPKAKANLAEDASIVIDI